MNYQKATIILTNERPIRIDADAWPVVARGGSSAHDGKIRCQANRITDAHVAVRQHADGRAIVIGHYGYDTTYPGEPNISARAGLRIAGGVDVVRAIRDVAHTLVERGGDPDHCRVAAERCVADLPPLDVD